MDAVAYQMSFDKEQLALLCANYDRRIDSLGAENKRLRAENAKLRELARDIYGEYRYLRVRFHRTYVQHEERMRAIERRMRELGVVVE